MKAPMILERYGGLVFVPFKAVGTWFKWIGREVFNPGGDLFFVAIIIFIVGLIASMFISGTIHVQVGADEGEIKSAYQEVLNRPADEEGLKTYLNSGKSIKEVKEALNASEEKKTIIRKAVENLQR